MIGCEVIFFSIQVTSQANQWPFAPMCNILMIKGNSKGQHMTFSRSLEIEVLETSFSLGRALNEGSAHLLSRITLPFQILLGVLYPFLSAGLTGVGELYWYWTDMPLSLDASTLATYVSTSCQGPQLPPTGCECDVCCQCENIWLKSVQEGAECSM